MLRSEGLPMVGPLERFFSMIWRHSRLIAS